VAQINDVKIEKALALAEKYSLKLVMGLLET
jgi:hypothetical protein